MSLSDIDYLKQSTIGEVISRGLAVLYKEQPSFPIDFLAKWLLNHSSTVLSEESYSQALLRQAQLRREEQEREEAEKRKRKKREEEEEKLKKIEEAFREKISEARFPIESLEEEVPEFIENKKKLTGVYIGELDFMKREVGEEEEEETAHLDIAGGKRINFVGASKSHEWVKGQSLGLESITAEVWKESPQEEVPEGQEPPPPKPK
jgi:hypothetical protein